MRVMVLGASANPSKFGNRAVRAYTRQGHVVLPVNPRGEPIDGLTCYRTVTEVPGPIDRVLVYLHADAGLQEMPKIAARGDVGEVWLNPGADDPQVIAAANRLGLTVVQACAILDIGERPH